MDFFLLRSFVSTLLLYRRNAHCAAFLIPFLRYLHATYGDIKAMKV
ncbi:hypothetical protein NHE_0545 [Neorickettsia helminthoeca str. Oregon]|uniref:Uncharacterized protein n=1 Tax=Neorickettsia helminthoeca str. Oregon TaxID=1286528 RepID=X5HM26_9RICK|nr:hypothetical protein NHE_0545 [Neorickettsia helminthoeca str. Oregon]